VLLWQSAITGDPLRVSEIYYTRLLFTVARHLVVYYTRLLTVNT